MPPNNYSKGCMYALSCKWLLLLKQNIQIGLKDKVKDLSPNFLGKPYKFSVPLNVCGLQTCHRNAGNGPVSNKDVCKLRRLLIKQS